MTSVSSQSESRWMWEMMATMRLFRPGLTRQWHSVKKFQLNEHKYLISNYSIASSCHVEPGTLRESWAIPGCPGRPWCKTGTPNLKREISYLKSDLKLIKRLRRSNYQFIIRCSKLNVISPSGLLLLTETGNVVSQDCFCWGGSVLACIEKHSLNHV